MMATRKVEIGATGETVRENIARIRRERGITLRELSRRLSTSDRPLSYPTLSQIETGARRIDVDDLMVLAIVLDVSPNTLLIPAASNSEESVNITGAKGVSLREVWYFLLGMRSLAHGDLEFATRSLPAELGRNARLSVSSTRSKEPLRISLQIETDGDTVYWKTGVGLDSIFDEDES